MKEIELDVVEDKEILWSYRVDGKRKYVNKEDINFREILILVSYNINL